MKKALYLMAFLVLGGISWLFFGKFSTAQISSHLIEIEIHCSLFERAVAKGSYGLGICTCDDRFEDVKVIIHKKQFYQYKNFLLNNNYYKIANVMEQIENHIEDKDYKSYIRKVDQYNQLIAALDESDRRSILNVLER